MSNKNGSKRSYEHLIEDIKRLHEEGKLDKEIAVELGLSPSSVYRYRTKYSKSEPKSAKSVAEVDTSEVKISEEDIDDVDTAGAEVFEAVAQEPEVVERPKKVKKVMGSASAKKQALIDTIRAMREDKWTNHDIAKHLNISYATVYRIIGKQPKDCEGLAAYEDAVKEEPVVQPEVVVTKESEADAPRFVESIERVELAYRSKFVAIFVNRTQQNATVRLSFGEEPSENRLLGSISMVCPAFRRLREYVESDIKRANTDKIIDGIAYRFTADTSYTDDGTFSVNFAEGTVKMNRYGEITIAEFYGICDILEKEWRAYEQM